MLRLLAIAWFSLSLSMAAQAVPTTWYVDDPLETFFGTITAEGPGAATIDITAFSGIFTERWTVPMSIDASIGEIESIADVFATTLLMSFSVPLLDADVDPAAFDPILANFSGESNLGPFDQDVFLTLTVIPTPPENPNPPVPVPATLSLFGLGLLGLRWSRRKRT